MAVRESARTGLWLLSLVSLLVYILCLLLMEPISALLCWRLFSLIDLSSLYQLRL